MSFFQCFVFHLRNHPLYPDFKQCVTFGSFPTEHMELVYNLSCILFLYFIPLFIIIVTYSCILAEITRTSKSHNNNSKLFYVTNWQYYTYLLAKQNVTDNIFKGEYNKCIYQAWGIRNQASVSKNKIMHQKILLLNLKKYDKKCKSLFYSHF